MLYIFTNSTLSHLQILFMLFLSHYIPFSCQLPMLKFHPSSSTLLKAFQNSEISWKIFFLVALISPPLNFLGFPGGSVVKKSTCQYKRFRRQGFDLWIRKILWRRKWQTTPVFLPAKSHGQRKLSMRL